MHVDMDAFFAAIEQADHPEWRGKPVIVGGSPDSRGVVSSASYEARRFGVHSAMPSARAKKLVPDAIWAPPRFERYSEVSRAVREIFSRHTPKVEAASIDEAYLDVTPASAASPDPVDIARHIQGDVAKLGITCSVGLATSRTVAKIASDFQKPNGLTVVRPGEEAAFLAPLPVRALPGIGPAAEKRLAGLGIRTLGELAALDDVTAVQALGDHALSYVRHARGQGSAQVGGTRRAKSLSKEHTFAHDISDRAEVEGALFGLAEAVGERLRVKEMAGRTVTLKLRFADFTTQTVRRTLPKPTNLGSEILPVALELLRSAWTPGVGLRLLGLGLSGFDAPVEQLDLFTEEETESARRRALAESVDAVRRKFGDDSVRMGPKR